MKRLFIVITVIAFVGLEGQTQQKIPGALSLQKSSEASTTQKKLTDLIGIWEFSGEQNAGAYLEIIDSATIILSYNGEKKKIIDYKIDFQKSPIWFDFTTRDTSSIVSVKSLLLIMNDSLLKWQLFVDEERTPFFSSSKGELVYLRKAKTISSAATAVASNQ